MEQGKASATAIPPDAQCSSCGYALRGLPSPVCPECGRGFDPADPSTFDSDPRQRRRRRLLVRGAAIVGFIALAAALGPRGILKADVTLTCKRCGKAETTTRWQLKPPRWIPFAYPGIESRTETTKSPPSSSDKVCNHTYDFKVQTDLPIGGWAACSGSLDPQPTTVNGAPLTVEDASPVLRAVLKPGNNGIGP